MNILGLSAYYHDSAAALIVDGDIVAAVQEERFSRKKFDASLPTQSVHYCLKVQSLALSDIDAIVFYDKPLVKFERLLETYTNFAPRGLRSFLRSMPVWLKQKLFLKTVIKKELSAEFKISIAKLPKLYFGEHHESHAASAFYPSPYTDAAVLCLDGVGEWASSTAWKGSGNHLEPLWEMNFPHSLGLLYSAFTYYTGFRVNSGEYKLMGLAPYGRPRYSDIILNELIDVKDDGSFRLNMKYFDFATGLSMINQKFDRLFGIPRRHPESELTQEHMDIASSIQQVTELIVTRLATTLQHETGSTNLCMAGGVALNCVSNGKLLENTPFEKLWIQPAAGDSGGAVGAALQFWHSYKNKPRLPKTRDSMQGSYLGPDYSETETKSQLSTLNAEFQTLSGNQLYSTVANVLAKKKVVGWFQGRMEFGPRALGNRSILGDPRGADTQTVVNLKIKYRESFRPFAPSVLEEKAQDYFQLQSTSPYMLLVAGVQEKHRVPVDNSNEKNFGIDLLKQARSSIPAVTHVDYSARIQTVSEDTNSSYYKLIKAFDELTDCPLLLNTSFNVRGEPIVNTPLDAYRCFMRTEMDYLVIGNLFFDKKQQAVWQEDEDWRRSLEMD